MRSNEATGRPRAARAAVALLALLAVSVAAAQGFSGTYRLPTDTGAAVTLVLEQQGSHVQGSLDVGGMYYQVEGEVDASGLYGLISSAQEQLYFEAEPYGDGLYLIMASVDLSTGRPDPATAGEYLFERAAAAPPAASTPGRGGKLIGAPPAAQAAPPAARPAPPPAAAPPATATPPAPPPAAAPAANQAPTQPADMQPARLDRRYEAGSRVGSADAGVSFVVPPEYYAGYLASENQFVIVSDTRPGLVVVRAITNMPLEDAATQLSSAWQSGESQLVLQGQPRIEGNVARASFTVSTPQGQGVLHVLGLAGSAGNVLMLGALGAPPESDALQALVEAIAAGAVVSPPTRADAQAAAAQLAGLQLSRSSSTSGGGYGDSHFSGSSTRLDLCSDGRYAYAYRSMTSVSVGGMGDLGGMDASSSDSDEAYGRWSVESGLLGPVLVLRADDGSGDSHQDLHDAGGTLYLNGTPVSVGRSPNCA